jgi:hypothetical protein
MFRVKVPAIIIYVFLHLNFLLIINTQTISLCKLLNDIKGNENDSLKVRRIRALCDAIQSTEAISNNEESDSIPDFDLTQIDSGNMH